MWMTMYQQHFKNLSQAEKPVISENLTKWNQNKKIPSLNIFNVEPNELIQFIEKGLEIKNFKIKELSNRKNITIHIIYWWLRTCQSLSSKNENWICHFYT